MEVLESSLLRRTVYAKRVGSLTSLTPDDAFEPEEDFGEKTPGRSKGRGGVPSRKAKASASKERNGGHTSVKRSTSKKTSKTTTKATSKKSSSKKKR